MEGNQRFQRYLNLLGVPQGPPGIEQLEQLVRAHLIRAPFENISKLYYLQRFGLHDIPDLGRYLDGLEAGGFGGTCYSNNVYLWGLLRYLRYDVALCGADMTEPDVHIVLIVRVQDHELMIDVGYGAPFFSPLPRDLTADHEISFGNERWLLRPQDEDGASQMEHYRRGELIHGYRAKPQPREPAFFAPAIASSMQATSTFMNNIRIVRFFDSYSLAINNLTLIEATALDCRLRKLADVDELVAVIEHRFMIPSAITRIALTRLTKPLKHPG